MRTCRSQSGRNAGGAAEGVTRKDVAVPVAVPVAMHQQAPVAVPVGESMAVPVAVHQGPLLYLRVGSAKQWDFTCFQSALQTFHKISQLFIT